MIDLLIFELDAPVTNVHVVQGQSKEVTRLTSGTVFVLRFFELMNGILWYQSSKVM